MRRNAYCCGAISEQGCLFIAFPAHERVRSLVLGVSSLDLGRSHERPFFLFAAGGSPEGSLHAPSKNSFSSSGALVEEGGNVDEGSGDDVC